MAAGTAVCVRCGLPVLVGQQWDLDHTPDRTGYLGVSHASCNRVAGARSGAQRAARGPRPRPSPPEPPCEDFRHPAPYRNPLDGRPWSRQWVYMTAEEQARARAFGATGEMTMPPDSDHEKGPM